MKIGTRSLDTILSDLVDCALLGADFYLTRDKIDTRIRAVYPPSTIHSFGTWHVVASWESNPTNYRMDTPISFAEAEEIIRNIYNGQHEETTRLPQYQARHDHDPQ